MNQGFQVWADEFGNLVVADGWITQLRRGVRLPVGSGADFSEILPAAAGSFTRLAAVGGATFVGGSGRNLVLAGLTPGPSGPALPIGVFRPGRPGVFGAGIFTLTVAGSPAAEITDGTDVVAELTAGGTAPVGSYVATTYGQTTYNGGSAFTLTAAAEDGAPGAIPDYVLSVSAGTAQAGVYTASDAANYVSADDSDWTIVVAADGSAELLCLAVVVATRVAGSSCEPSGIYEATAAGEAAYNGGDAWRAFVTVTPRVPGAGFVYLTVTETGGVLTSVAGPFFAAALPADSTVEFHPPIAQSDGSGGQVQFHTGMLIWPD